MKHIDTDGRYREALQGSENWYWAADNCNADFYEAKEAFQLGQPLPEHNLIFVHYPSGRKLLALEKEKGQYFGAPKMIDGICYLLAVNFLLSKLKIYQFDLEKS